MNFFPFLPQILTTATEIPHTPQPHSSNSASTTTGSQSRHINKLLRSVQDGSEEDSGRKWQKFIHLSTDHFTLLTTCFQQQQEVLRSFLLECPRKLRRPGRGLPGPLPSILVLANWHFRRNYYPTLPPRIPPPPRRGIVVLANFRSVPGILAGGLGGRVGVYS